MKFESILFDLDGTLLSTEEDLAIASNYAFEKLGYKVNATNQTIRRGIGIRIEPMLHLVADEAGVNIEGQFEQVCNLFMQYYAAHNDEHTHPFENVVETVRALNALGLKTGVISNKPHESAVACVKRYFGDLFSFAVGSVLGQPIKPKKEVFDNLAAQHGLRAETCLYVGDMKYDVMFARNVGMKVAICNYGYGTAEDRANADFTIDNFSQLLEIVRD